MHDERVLSVTQESLGLHSRRGQGCELVYVRAGQSHPGASVGVGTDRAWPSGF